MANPAAGRQQPSDASPELTAREQALREDLNREYYAILGVVSDFDARQMVIKGWSVTLSLAALGLGFQTQHYALFGLAAMTALGFWFLDLLVKQFQVRYYPRMRDIEFVASKLNSTTLPGIGQVSSPRIDMYWSYRGQPSKEDWRGHEPERMDAHMVHRLFALRPWLMPQVLLPHWVAVVVGSALFVASAMNVSWLAPLTP